MKKINALFSRVLLSKVLLVGLALMAATLSIGQEADYSGVRKAAKSAGFQADRLARLDNVMRALVAKRSIAGGHLLVWRKGNLAYDGAFGFADVDANIPLDTKGIYRLAELSEPLAAIALMQLVERGLILLSDPVEKYIPELGNREVLHDPFDPAIYSPALAKIKVIDLLTHSAGLTEVGNSDILAQEYQERGITPGEKFAASANLHSSMSSIIADLSVLPLLNEPSTVYRKSIAIDIVGRLIEVISGLTYPAFLKQYVLEPARLTDTSFFLSHAQAEQRARLLALYDRLPLHSLRAVDLSVATAWGIEPAVPSAGKGLLASSYDFLLIAQQLLGHPAPKGETLLAPSSTKRIMQAYPLQHASSTNQLGTSTKQLAFSGVGLGGRVASSDDSKGSVIPQGAYGNISATGCFFYVVPDDDLIVLFMSQVQPLDSRVLLQLSELIMQAKL